MFLPGPREEVSGGQTKQNHYFVDSRRSERGQPWRVGRTTADYFFVRLPTQQNKNFVAFTGCVCYNMNTHSVFIVFSGVIMHL